MPFRKPGHARRRHDSELKIMKRLIGNLIRWAQKWSHGRIGWLGNKAGLIVGAWLTQLGMDGDSMGATVAGAVIALLSIALEVGVKVASDRFIGGVQLKAGLTKDNWAGPKTLRAAGVVNNYPS